MTRKEILEQLKNLPTVERLSVIEEALRLVHADLQQSATPSLPSDKIRRLTVAAETLLSDYSAGGDLMVFTALDGEEFHAEG